MQHLNYDQGRYVNWSNKPFEPVWPVVKGTDWINLPASLRDQLTQQQIGQMIGQSCFLRCGCFAFDVDFGEANVITDISPDGYRIQFKYPWMRDYDKATRPTTTVLGQDAELPFRRSSVSVVSIVTGNAFAMSQSSASKYVTIGETTVELVTDKDPLNTVRNMGDPVSYPAGSPVTNAVGLFLTTMPQNFIVKPGTYASLNLSRTIGAVAKGVTVIQKGEDWPVPLVLDATRAALFEDCTFIHMPSKEAEQTIYGHGISRCATDIELSGCRFVNTLFGAGEASQGLNLHDSFIFSHGTNRLNAALIIGYTTSYCRVQNNEYDLNVNRYVGGDIGSNGYKGVGNELE